MPNIEVQAKPRDEIQAQRELSRLGGLPVSEVLAQALVDRCVIRVEFDIEPSEGWQKAKGGIRSLVLADLDGMEFLASRAKRMSELERKQWALAIRAMEHDALLGGEDFAKAWMRPWRGGSRMEKALGRMGKSAADCFIGRGFGALSAGLTNAFQSGGFLCTHALFQAACSDGSRAWSDQEAKQWEQMALSDVFGAGGRLSWDEFQEQPFAYGSQRLGAIGKPEFARAWEVRQFKRAKQCEVEPGGSGWLGSLRM